MSVAIADFRSYRESVEEALDGIGAKDRLAGESAVLIKPNLVNASPHPVTTPPECCAAVIEYVRSCTSADIVVAEGTGDASIETNKVFDRLGYTKLAGQYDVALVDLNTESLRKLENMACSAWRGKKSPIWPKNRTLDGFRTLDSAGESRRYSFGR
jgi:uncharacterized protein (DUF362 family)